MFIHFPDLKKSVSNTQVDQGGSRWVIWKKSPWDSSESSGTTRCSARQDWMIWAKVPTWSAPDDVDCHQTWNRLTLGTQKKKNFEKYIRYIIHLFKSYIGPVAQAPIPASLHIFSAAWLDVPESKHKRCSLGARFWVHHFVSKIFTARNIVWLWKFPVQMQLIRNGFSSLLSPELALLQQCLCGICQLHLMSEPFNQPNIKYPSPEKQF